MLTSEEAEAAKARAVEAAVKAARGEREAAVQAAEQLEREKKANAVAEVRRLALTPVPT